MAKKFSSCKENFVCDNCGKEIIGNGFTNHCPFCLYSKHIDINPGDRMNKCLGLMKPISVELKGGGSVYTIVYKCLKCGVLKKNRSAKNDSFQTILFISKGE